MWIEGVIVFIGLFLLMFLFSVKDCSGRVYTNLDKEPDEEPSPIEIY